MIGLNLDRKKCLFQYVVCEDGTSPRVDYKIMKPKRAQKELRNYRIIRRIDPNHKFSAPTPKMCNVNMRVQGEVVGDQIVKCNRGRGNIRFNGKYSALLIDRSDAAISDISMFVLASLFDVPAQRAQALLGLRRLFYGLKKMSDAGFCHNGITPENVVIDINSRFYINDFEFLRKHNKYEHDYSNYYAYPAPQVFTDEDLKIVYSQIQEDNLSYIIAKSRRDYFTGFTIEFFENMLSNHMTINELGDNIFYFFRQMNKISKNEKAFIRNVKRILCKSRDIYSLGITLFYLIETVLSFSENRAYLERILHDLIKIAKNMVLIYWRLTPSMLLQYYDSFLRKSRINYRTEVTGQSPKQGSLTVSSTPSELKTSTPAQWFDMEDIGGLGVTPPEGFVEDVGGAGVTPPTIAAPVATVPVATAPVATAPTDCKSKNKQQCNADETCFYVDGAKRKYCRNKRKPKANGTKKKAKQPKTGAQQAPAQPVAKAQQAPTAQADCKSKNKQQCNADETCFYVDGAKRKYCRNKRKPKANGTKKKAKQPKPAAQADCKSKNKQQCNADETCFYVDGAKRKYCRNKRNTKKKNANK